MKIPPLFIAYLQKRGLAPNTIKAYSQHLLYFFSWIESNALELLQVEYKDLLVYLQYMKAQDFSRKRMNIYLRIIRYYFDWMLKTGQSSIHPSTNLYVRGIKRHTLPSPLDIKVLERLYENYEVTTAQGQQRKVMLGFLIYQALTRAELGRVESTHLQLKEGKLYIPGSNKTGRRTLKLQASQVLDLQEYLTVSMPLLLASRKTHSPYLFRGLEGSSNLANELAILFTQLKKMNPVVKNASQLRISVISHWLKSKDIRIVQYLAGHKYVSSTERYQTTGIEDLKVSLSKHHPLS